MENDKPRGPWGMIAIFPGGRRKEIVFTRKPEDTWKTMLPKVKDYVENYKCTNPEAEVYIVSRLKAFPPPQGWYYGRVSNKKFEFYCPYCRTFQFFQPNYQTGYLHCPLCGISYMDFYVRFYNQGQPDMVRIMAKGMDI